MTEKYNFIHINAFLLIIKIIIYYYYNNKYNKISQLIMLIYPLFFKEKKKESKIVFLICTLFFHIGIQISNEGTLIFLPYSRDRYVLNKLVAGKCA